MNIYALAAPTFSQMLAAMKGQLDRAAAFAAAEGIDPRELIEARLAPDMFPLAVQVRFAGFQVVSLVKELTGANPPDFADDEATFEALKDRIDAVLAFLNSATEADLNAAAGKAVALELQNGIVLDFTAEQYVRDWAIPQFYFHLITTYAILRHKGVPLGKPDYVPHVRPFIRPGTLPTA